MFNNIVPYTFPGIIQLGAKLNLPAPVILLTVISETSIKVDWSLIEAAEEYSVERSVDGVAYTELDTTENVTYTDTLLTEGTLYYYRVRAFTGNNFSKYSNVDLAIPYPAYTLYQDFDNISDFTIVNNSDTIEINNNIKIDGAGSLLMKTSAAGIGVVDFALPNLKFNQIAGLIRLFKPIDDTGSSYIFFLSTTTNFAAGTFTSASIIGYEGRRDQTTRRSGWNNHLFRRSNFSGGTPAILDNPESVFVLARIRFEASRGPVYFDSLRFGGPQKAVVCPTFDDGDDSLFDVNDAVFGIGKSAFDYMVEKGIIATSYLVSTSVDQPNFVTKAQCQQMYNAGWDLGNHGTHKSWITLTDEEITADVFACRDFLINNGWKRGALHFAYPGGEFTLDTHPTLAKNIGLKTARTIQDTIQNTQFDPVNLFYLSARGVNSGTTSAQITVFVDEAIASGRMFSFYVHAIGEPESANTWSPVKFKTVIDYLATKKAAGEIEVMTISQWYDLVT